MTTLAVVLGVGLALGATLLPAAALAGGRFHSSRPHGGFHRSGGVHGGGAFGGHRHHDGHVHRKFHHRFHRGKSHHSFVGAFPSVLFFAPAVVDSPPPVVSPSVVVYASPIVYASPTVVSALPAPSAGASAAVAPMPTVVEYSTGRYELRGDGVATPYAWVWIPNPPDAPPAPEELPAPSAARESRSQLYRWTDEDGTTFVTNRPPEPHRSGASSPDIPAGDPS